MSNPHYELMDEIDDTVQVTAGATTEVVTHDTSWGVVAEQGKGGATVIETADQLIDCLEDELAEARANIERLRVENAALQADAVKWKLVLEMPAGAELYHCGSQNSRDPSKPWYVYLWRAATLAFVEDTATPDEGLRMVGEVKP
jgi:hypothetical protein